MNEMDLLDSIRTNIIDVEDAIREQSKKMLSFREQLIISLASNPMYVVNMHQRFDNASVIICQADAIIESMETMKGGC